MIFLAEPQCERTCTLVFVFSLCQDVFILCNPSDWKYRAFCSLSQSVNMQPSHAVLLLQSLECWDYRSVVPCLGYRAYFYIFIVHGVGHHSEYFIIWFCGCREQAMVVGKPLYLGDLYQIHFVALIAFARQSIGGTLSWGLAWGVGSPNNAEHIEFSWTFC